MPNADISILISSSVQDIAIWKNVTFLTFRKCEDADRLGYVAIDSTSTIESCHEFAGEVFALLIHGENNDMYELIEASTEDKYDQYQERLRDIDKNMKQLTAAFTESAGLLTYDVSTSGLLTDSSTTEARHSQQSLFDEDEQREVMNKYPCAGAQDIDADSSSSGESSYEGQNDSDDDDQSSTGDTQLQCG